MGEPRGILSEEAYVSRSAQERAGRASLHKEPAYVAKIQSVFNDIRTNGYSKIQPFSVGRVEARMRRYSQANSVDMADGGLYMSYNSIAHATRNSKIKDGVVVTEKELTEFPSKRGGMDLYYDKTARLFIYVDEAQKAKFVIHPSYSLQIKRKQAKRVNFITASRLKSTENFHRDKGRYDKI